MKIIIGVCIYALVAFISIVFFDVAWEDFAGLLVFIFFIGIFVLAFKGMFQSTNKTIRINKSGELIQGTVLSIKQTNCFDGPDPEVIVDVRIQEPDDSTYRAVIRGTVKLVELAAYQPGKKIEVVRDREDREQVVFKHRFFKELQEKHRKDMAKKQAKQEKKMAGQVK
ncbi:MAG: hypothetical protein GX143_13305 [Alcaligenaceae bacterium]|jgi:hypothetical protein|nr:hypothetical protein [Alcaligenaceae bacterium]